MPFGFATVNGGIAQLVERLVRNEKARGSNPLTSKLESFQGCRTEALAKTDTFAVCDTKPVESGLRRRVTGSAD